MTSTLEIDGAHAGVRFSAAHFIPRHEKCSRLHGHSYIVHLRLEGEIGKDGMLMDFVVLKKELRAIADELDHSVMLPARSEDVTIKEDGDDVIVDALGKHYVFPKMDTRMLPVAHTTAEEMSKAMAEKIVREVEIPSNVRTLSVGLDEERGQTAWYTMTLRRRRPSSSCREDSTRPPPWRTRSTRGTSA